MFIPDMPNVPPQDVPVMIAQANQAQSGNVMSTRSIGVCRPIPNGAQASPSGENGLVPIGVARDYFYLYEHQKMVTDPATLTILQQPKHGILRPVIQADVGTILPSGGDPVDPSAGLYFYLPEKGYVGKDSATFQVDFGGVKVNVKYYFQAVDLNTIGEGVDEYLCKKSPRWKISTTLNPDGTSTLTSVEYQSPAPSAADQTATDAAALASTLGLNFATGADVLGSATVDPSSPASTSSGQTSASLGAGFTLNLAPLPGGAIGQTVGTHITLDPTAAGNNWFIDTTPADNSEYLPTSNPNEWVARAGSAAAGKMDMLSVLLHEYGHALGIEHSADGHDYMGTTLTAGVRRLPSATEMALMQQLVAQAKGEIVGRVTPADSTPGNTPIPFPLPLGGMGFAFAGLLRSSRYGGSSIDVVTTQYDVAANATFTNLDTATAWQTQGSVEFRNQESGIGNQGVATLHEVSTAQTRLSQVFMLGANDRYLSFTLGGTALDNPSGMPQDAFEIALLDANTGLSVLGSDGLTRTDAFLNLQADGAQHTADCVTCINNADGSRTYRVDLTNVAKNRAVNLSFDLLGFGVSNSHVTLRDMRVSGLPQLRDDVATLAEDNLLSFDPYAQADSQLKPLLASHIVAAPTHGVLAMNADGTFAYTPDLNYFGADSFSYNLSDGPLDSNLATVTLTVTPVNDAPVAADAQATTAEDTPLVIALGAYAITNDLAGVVGQPSQMASSSISDVDSTNITTQIVTGPAHGVLVQNNDGTYSYTPDANYNGVDSFTYKANDGQLDSNIATVTLGITPVNDAPVAGNLNLAAVEDTALPMNLLAAASDIDSSTLAAAIVATAQHGQVNINADGSFTYTPLANYNGIDSFTYKVNDGALDSNVATVSLA